jgi:hypothetical protein
LNQGPQGLQPRALPAELPSGKMMELGKL